VSLLWNARDVDERSDNRPETPSSVMQVGNFKRAIGSRVIQIHSISILAPLAVGVVAQACTIIIYLVPVRATVSLIRREKGLGHVGMPWTDLGIFARAVFYASLAHLVEIALWAALFIICGEFTDFGTAFLPLRGQLHVLRLR
jgi:hypothetical protein